MTVIEIMRELQTRQISFLVEGSNIVLGNGKGKIQDSLLAEIRIHKQELINFYNQSILSSVNRRVLPVEEQQYYDLSYMQRNIWIDQKLNPDIPYYNVGTAWTIYGEPDKHRFKQAVDKVIQTHEILRTGFKIVDWDPKQIIFRQVRFSLEYLDISDRKDVIQEINNVTNEVKNIIFDLENPPLFKIFLLKEATDKYHLIFIIHHIISDGWSLRIFFDQVMQQYQLSENETGPGSTEKPLQYKDYASWQNNQLTGSNVGPSKNFWIQKFRDGHNFIFTQNHLSSKQITYSGASKHFEIYDSGLKQINFLCTKLNSTRFILFLSLIKLVLFSFTGTKRITVETGVIERDQGDLASQIGPYLSDIPVQVEIEQNWSFNDFVQQVKSEFILTLSHKWYPIHLIKNDLKQLDNSYAELTNVSFTFHNEGLLNENEIYVNGLKIVKSEFNLVKVLKGMSFHCYEYKRFLRLNIDYSLELFNEQFVDEISREFFRIIDVVSENTEIPIKDLARPHNGFLTMDLKFDFA